MPESTSRAYFGDCREVMHRLIAGDVKVQTCVTSPPYWGLRDYGIPPVHWPAMQYVPATGLPPVDVPEWDGVLGLEPDPLMFVAHSIAVFRLVRELLADDGTCWINYGDSYASAGGAGWQGKHGQRANCTHTQRALFKQSALNGLKPKDLVMMPARVALALQADGWYVRNDIIWHKPNPMPESIRDRCTKAHEYIFLLAKAERYYYDADAIKEPASDGTHSRRAGNGIKMPDGWDTGPGGHGSYHRNGREKGKRHLPGNISHKGTAAYESGSQEHRTKAGLVEYSRKIAQAGSGIKNNYSMDESLSVMPENRNKRDVWTVASRPYKEAHFATYPVELIEPCILAGSRPGDIVLDPFFGSGATGQAAERLGRRWIGIELNQAYEPLQKKRTEQMGMLI